MEINKYNMKTYSFYRIIFVLVCFVGIVSCSEEYELPDHKLDVEFNYELTCSSHLLKYVKPKVVITDGNGKTTSMIIESNMWTGNEHKTWSQSVHYDSLNVSNTMTVEYIPLNDVIFNDEENFENIHHLSCRISVTEDGDGRRNNFTIIPDFPSDTNVKADILENYIKNLCSKSTTRGGRVGKDGEITKIDAEN